MRLVCRGPSGPSFRPAKARCPARNPARGRSRRSAGNLGQGQPVVKLLGLQRQAASASLACKKRRSRPEACGGDQWRQPAGRPAACLRIIGASRALAPLFVAAKNQSGRANSRRRRQCAREPHSTGGRRSFPIYGPRRSHRCRVASHRRPCGDDATLRPAPERVFGAGKVARGTRAAGRSSVGPIRFGLAGRPATGGRAT